LRKPTLSIAPVKITIVPLSGEDWITYHFTSVTREKKYETPHHVNFSQFSHSPNLRGRCR
ncbi:MAG: hypothetical protein PWK00_02730, partial [Coxiella burnetii]|nr:hypothetical protein [Coxiella burnetii]